MGCSASKKVHTPRRFQPILDRYTSISQVQQAVRDAGLESSNLVLGVDFTKSNTWTGQRSFGGRCLHDTDTPTANPYQRVIEVIGRTLEDFDDDKLIPAYGFGDSTTGDSKCFPFHPDDRPSHGVNAVLERYTEITKTINLAGPTSFAPVIREAIRVVREEQCYHILVIIADGQVTDATPTGATAQAIIEASNYPLSIVVVGVGDGPWDIMETYDDELPERRFDNFQFVDFNAVCRPPKGARCLEPGEREARFALHALMEVPDQYAYIKKYGLLNPESWPHAAPRTRQLAAAPAGVHTPLAISLPPSPANPPPMMRVVSRAGISGCPPKQMIGPVDSIMAAGKPPDYYSSANVQAYGYAAPAAPG